MRTTVYVDVLLVINYIINVLLILCTIKFSGVAPKRRKIVAAALFGSLCSLTIFLPFLGFFPELLLKLLVSGSIVRIAISWNGRRMFFQQWFVFFAVNFFFAGVMLAIWMVAAPRWLTYYNGVIYFDISPFFLLAATVLAYIAIVLAGRLAGAGRMQRHIYRVQIYLKGRICGVNGLVDTGNGLTEPFSGTPVMVCGFRDIQSLLPERTAAAIAKGISVQSDLSSLEIPLRLIPYHGIGGTGILPAFAPDKLVVRSGEESGTVDAVYVAISMQPVGDSRYNAVLNPEMVRITACGAKR